MNQGGLLRNERLHLPSAHTISEACAVPITKGIHKVVKGLIRVHSQVQKRQSCRFPPAFVLHWLEYRLIRVFWEYRVGSDSGLDKRMCFGFLSNERCGRKAKQFICRDYKNQWLSHLYTAFVFNRPLNVSGHTLTLQIIMQCQIWRMRFTALRC